MAHHHDCAVFACLLTGLAVVTTTHMTRVQFAELQRLEQEENQLQTEWGQLLLEEGLGQRQPALNKLPRNG